ncbi:MAG: hypothetical protein ACM34E_01905 [Acidobacteriota bacterium]
MRTQTIPMLVVLTFLAIRPTAGAIQGNQPLHEGPFQVHVTFQDFFADPRGPHCAFRVVGDWDVTVRDEIYFDQQSGQVIRVHSFFTFVGTLSNADTRASVPDGGAFQLIDYFAADGSTIKGVEIENRRLSPYLHATFRAVTDTNGNLVFDSGRDWLFTARHPLDISALCLALSN